MPILFCTGGFVTQTPPLNNQDLRIKKCSDCMSSSLCMRFRPRPRTGLDRPTQGTTAGIASAGISSAACQD